MKLINLKFSILTLLFLLLGTLPTLLYIWLHDSDDKTNKFSFTIPRVDIKPDTLVTRGNNTIIPNVIDWYDTLYLSDKTPNTIVLSGKSKPKMDSSTIVALLTCVSLILTTIFNPLAKARFKELGDKLDTVLTRIAAVEVITHKYTTETNVIKALQSIINDSLMYAPNEVVADFINREGVAILSFCKYVNATGFGIITPMDIMTKVRHIVEQGIDLFEDKFGTEYASKVKDGYTASLCSYKDAILRIKEDGLTNNKDARFRALSESFVHDHISFLIKSYFTFNGKSN